MITYEEIFVGIPVIGSEDSDGDTAGASVCCRMGSCWKDDGKNCFFAAVDIADGILRSLSADGSPYMPLP